MGRDTSVKRYGERIIDIDIIDYDRIVSSTDRLQLPHIYMSERSFVLYPLRDVYPDYIHPVTKDSVQQMINAISDNLDIRNISNCNKIID